MNRILEAGAETLLSVNFLVSNILYLTQLHMAYLNRNRAFCPTFSITALTIPTLISDK